MSQKIPSSLRLAAAQRAGGCCEYCLVRERDSIIDFQADHIISRKHGGPTILENLAWACVICNRNKGSNVATINFPESLAIRLFNPRTDRWEAHFFIDDGQILPKTAIGESTVKVLELNQVDRIIERRLLFESGNWPGRFAISA